MNRQNDETDGKTAYLRNIHGNKKNFFKSFLEKPFFTCV